MEIELFFKIVESEIRRKHIVYLKNQKCNSVAAEHSIGEQSPAEGEKLDDDFPKDEKRAYVKRFNKGIDTALKVLQREFKAFSKRMDEDKKGGKKF